MGEQEEQQLDYEYEELNEFYCFVCSNTFDTSAEFKGHLESTEHADEVETKVSKLASGDPFCSYCYIKIDSWPKHCQTSDHSLFRDAVMEVMPSAQEPVLEKFNHRNLVSLKPGSTQERLTKQGCVGLAKIQYWAPSNSWFCGLCLETFTSGIDLHCANSDHVIQSIKEHDPTAAYDIKQLSIVKGSSRAFRTKIREKVKEIFEIEKESPDVLRFLLTLTTTHKIIKRSKSLKSEILAEKVPIKMTKTAPAKTKPAEKRKKKKGASPAAPAAPAPQKEQPPPLDSVSPAEEESLLDKSASPEPAIAPTTSQHFPSPGDNAPLSAPEKPASPPAADPVPSEQAAPDVADPEPATPDLDGIVLFEEEDRTLLPEVKTRKATYDTLLTGVRYVEQKKNKSYHCTLCDITLTKELTFAKTHMTASLHRRKIVTANSTDPVPPYLEELRKKDAELYAQLLDIECRALEKKERENETREQMKLRAGILGLPSVDELPPPLADVVPLTADQEKLFLRELAERWHCAKNNITFVSSKPSTKSNTIITTSSVNTNSAAPAISELQPQLNNLMVGVHALQPVKSASSSVRAFWCSLCKVKLGIKREQKPHVLGRLHKMKALSAAYSETVEKFLSSKMSKDGYGKTVTLINDACIALEKQEIETEGQEVREVRAYLLGVKVENLPLPMITLSNTTPIDIKKMAADWLKKEQPAQTPSTPTTPADKAVLKVANVEVNLGNLQKSLDGLGKRKSMEASGATAAAAGGPSAKRAKETSPQSATEVADPSSARNTRGRSAETRNPRSGVGEEPRKTRIIVRNGAGGGGGDCATDHRRRSAGIGRGRSRSPRRDSRPGERGGRTGGFGRGGGGAVNNNRVSPSPVSRGPGRNSPPPRRVSPARGAARGRGNRNSSPPRAARVSPVRGRGRNSPPPLRGRGAPVTRGGGTTRGGGGTGRGGGTAHRAGSHHSAASGGPPARRDSDFNTSGGGGRGGNANNARNNARDFPPRDPPRGGNHGTHPSREVAHKNAPRGGGGHNNFQPRNDPNPRGSSNPNNNPQRNYSPNDFDSKPLRGAMNNSRGGGNFRGNDRAGPNTNGGNFGRNTNNWGRGDRAINDHLPGPPGRGMARGGSNNNQGIGRPMGLTGSVFKNTALEDALRQVTNITNISNATKAVIQDHMWFKR